MKLPSKLATPGRQERRGGYWNNSKMYAAKPYQAQDKSDTQSGIFGFRLYGGTR